MILRGRVICGSDRTWRARCATSALVLIAGCGRGPVTPGAPVTPPSADTGSTLGVEDPPATLGGCVVFPADTFFHAVVEDLPVHPDSARWIRRLGAGRALRVPAAANTDIPWAPVRYGVPITLADADTPRREVTMDGHYPVDRQYQGPYPIPPGLDVQTGFDQQTIIVDVEACAAYELIGYSNIFRPMANGGVRWDLATHDALPDAAAVTAPRWPILGTVLRADEIRAGRIDHVLAFTIPDVARDAPEVEGDVLWPALASDGTADEPDAVPMGAWLRLRADVDLSGAPAAVQVVGDALRRHGMLLGDTGGTADALHLKLEKREVWQDASGADVARILTDLGPWITAGDLEVIDPTSIRAEDGGAYGGAFAIR